MLLRTHVEDFESGTFEITEREAKTLCENSVERVLNTTYGVLMESRHADADQALEDIRDLKRLIVGLWNAARTAAFCEHNNIKPS